MQFLVSVIDHETGRATSAEMAAIDAFNERLMADGHWVFAGGLTPPGAAAVLDGRGDQPTEQIGTLSPMGGEYLSGCWIISAPDVATARALAFEGSRCCNRRVELRPFLGDEGIDR